MSDWQNPIAPINFEQYPLPMAKARRCALNPTVQCSAGDCMAWATVTPGKAPDGSDSQGNCLHMIDKSTEIQKRIREQLQAAMYERDKHFAMQGQFGAAVPEEPAPTKAN